MGVFLLSRQLQVVSQAAAASPYREAGFNMMTVAGRHVVQVLIMLTSQCLNKDYFG